MGRFSARARRAAPGLGVLALLAACGSVDRPPLETSTFGGPPAGKDAGAAVEGGRTSLDNPEAGPPSCDAGDVCGCLDLTLLGDPPNIFFMLDRSGSMNDLGKWTTVRDVIVQVIEELGPRARFAAAMFPSPQQDVCNVGNQVMPLMLGDVPAGAFGQTAGFFLTATDVPASGGTPTAGTFTALTPALTGFGGKTYVILATDGGPNCNYSLTCAASACCSNIEGDPGCTEDGGPNCCASAPYNCLDAQASIAAIGALASAGVPTYVIGLPESAPYEGVLDQMALAGRTARASAPYYFAVDSADEAALASTLSTIAAQVTATCTFTLSSPPPDPGMVNLYLDGQIVPQDPVNGWTLSGQTVTLVGNTCSEVLAGDALALRIVAGCPTVQQ
jgi:hypothetical protein